ncbi:MAG: DUF2267 domain-containing protein [Spirulinaceae cyanobacterium RM2_2_10]|nr:DUF2267 domain-containing protein [Spirulinaceae cyanobacterium SM2_1_0]NJO19187.1 DUF2267 domain-containing protein [Spirulinaceae cyanobacterium RM2_2_10]
MTTAPIPAEQQAFLTKVQADAGLRDIYDARDLSLIVFRTMRDLLPTDASDRVAAELHVPVIATDKKALQKEVADLWQDTNPLVAWLSRLRGPLSFDADLFIRRVEQEGGLPRGTTGITAIKAVFVATKAELSAERSTELVQYLPGEIKTLWEQA